MLLVILHKFIGRRRSMDESGADEVPVERIIARIQQGDVKLRNQFITDYQPLVAKMAGRFCRRYIDPAHDDEFSVALVAFNEAINHYSKDAGGTFFSFAETVIKRRLIDYFRKENRQNQHVPYSTFDVEDEECNVVNPILVNQSIEQYENERLRIARQHEIMEYATQLQQYGISFEELTNISPKHQDSRESMIAIGKAVAANQEWMKMLLGKKMLPIKPLSEAFPVSRKTLERNRKYIIAIALVVSGPYPHLQEYLITDERRKEEST